MEGEKCLMDNRKNMLSKVKIIVWGIHCYKMRQIIWSQAIKCYICMHKNFKVDSKFNREPMLQRSQQVHQSCCVYLYGGRCGTLLSRFR